LPGLGCASRLCSSPPATEAIAGEGGVPSDLEADLVGLLAGGQKTLCGLNAGALGGMVVDDEQDCLWLQGGLSRLLRASPEG